MHLYKLWLQGQERVLNYLVSAEDSDQAKQLVCEHLSNPTVYRDLRVGFSDEHEAKHVTVKTVNPYGGSRHSTAWDEWISCKRSNVFRVITSFRP